MDVVFALPALGSLGLSGAAAMDSGLDRPGLSESVGLGLLTVVAG